MKSILRGTARMLIVVATVMLPALAARAAVVEPIANTHAIVRVSDLAQSVRDQLNPIIVQAREDAIQAAISFGVTVADKTDDELFLDANHPLAGKALIFDVELVAIA